MSASGEDITEPAIDADQIRGIAMALRHWFEVIDLEPLMREVGIREPKRGLFGRKAPCDKRTFAFSYTALPPQIVRLKHDAPIRTLHMLQDVYDDGEMMRADPWRWWFAWIAIEIIARLGPDPTGRLVREFILKDDSLENIRATAARWLASNPERLEILNRDFAGLVEKLASEAIEREGIDRAEALMTAVRSPLSVLESAMASEGARLSSALTIRIADRVSKS
jgi:hypothetical protein